MNIYLASQMFESQSSTQNWGRDQLTRARMDAYRAFLVRSIEHGRTVAREALSRRRVPTKRTLGDGKPPQDAITPSLVLQDYSVYGAFPHGTQRHKPCPHRNS